MDKYIIDGVEYSRGEEVEVGDKPFGFKWYVRKFISYQPERENFKIKTDNFGSGTFENYEFIRKIKSPLSGRKAKLTIDDGTEMNVTID